MTVQELRDALAQYDDNTKVQIFDSEWGYIDITDIFHSDHKQQVCIS